jgi:hypothetical protein
LSIFTCALRLWSAAAPESARETRRIVNILKIFACQISANIKFNVCILSGMHLLHCQGCNHSSFRDPASPLSRMQLLICQEHCSSCAFGRDTALPLLEMQQLLITDKVSLLLGFQLLLYPRWNQSFFSDTASPLYSIRDTGGTPSWIKPFLYQWFCFSSVTDWAATPSRRKTFLCHWLTFSCIRDGAANLSGI